MQQDNQVREFRFAVVFYGGVSLAVYENGVARAFYDAVEEVGVFKPLSTLLGGRFVVDVISGASAGGINGLMLAAALESGANFADTAKLWRDAGGLQELLKPVSKAAETKSLLSEEYYLDQLRGAFKHVCTTPKGAAKRTAKEIDVYVTGTDLNGQVATFQDATGTEISVKNHALVFHLKHRTGRARLGVLGSHDTLDDDERQLQVDTLSCVARITSSFPGAFPPFTFDELSSPKTLHPKTRLALHHLSARTQPAIISKQHKLEGHHLIDGGVLENSPFGPVLEAIFHRMPSPDSIAVERTLFYVEPDPKLSLYAGGFTPVQVALNSVLSLPSYDGIAEDVRRLLAHNDAVRRASALREAVHADLRTDSVRDVDSPAYRAALTDSIACLLLGIAPNEIATVRNLHAVSKVLASKSGLADREALQALDITFHLRRAFYSLYPPNCNRPGDIPDSVNREHAVRGGDGVLSRDQLNALGRLVKALKLLRDVWLSAITRQQPATQLLEAQLIRGEPLPKDFEAEVLRRLALLQHYLNGEWFDAATLSDAPSKHSLGWLWALTDENVAPSSISPLSDQSRVALEVADKLLNQEQLGEMRSQAMRWLEQQPVDKVWPLLEASTKPRVLIGLQKVHCTLTPASARQFAAVDMFVFPSELAGGMYELDEVALARIAPTDPKLPAGIAGHEKVTGDLLAHFSAFFRRDWRTNDIAWGQVDALHQIITVVLSDAAWKRARVGRDATDFTRALSELAALKGAAPELLDALRALQREPDNTAHLAAFRELLIQHAQEEAMKQYVKLLQQDRKMQDELWSWQSPPLQPEGPTAVDSFVNWKLGARTIAQDTPPSLLAEYGGQAGLLLWGMLKPTLKGGAATRAASLGRVLQPVLWLVHSLGRSSRIDRGFAFAFLFALFVGGLGFALAGFFAESWRLGALGVAVALFPITLAYWFAMRRVVALMVVTVALLGGVAWVTTVTRPIKHWVGQALLDAGHALKPAPDALAPGAPGPRESEPRDGVRRGRRKHDESGKPHAPPRRVEP